MNTLCAISFVKLLQADQGAVGEKGGDYGDKSGKKGAGSSCGG